MSAGTRGQSGHCRKNRNHEDR